MSGFEPWRTAMERALYGPGGFYRRELPSHHFTTSAQTPAFADSIARLVDEVDGRLGRPASFAVVDVGAGGGDLLTHLAETLDERVRLVAVELRPRPRGLPERIEWRGEPPERVEGLLIACELLDNVPCDVAVVDQAGHWRYEEVDRQGRTRPGGGVGGEDAKWLAEWWPVRFPGERAEIGRPRDAAWRGLAGRLARGTVLAIDYGHLRGDRPGGGTVNAFRDGRRTAPVPDGSCDITAHVAVDAVGADRVETQREALLALGASAENPPMALAYEDPTAYAMALARAGTVARLMDPEGLGAHWWMRTDRLLGEQLLGAGHVRRLHDPVHEQSALSMAPARRSTASAAVRPVSMTDSISGKSAASARRGARVGKPGLRGGRGAVPHGGLRRALKSRAAPPVAREAERVSCAGYATVAAGRRALRNSLGLRPFRRLKALLKPNWSA